MTRSSSSSRKNSGWRELSILVGAGIGGGLLILVLLGLGLAWGMRHELKASRQRLMGAVASHVAQAELIEWSEVRLLRGSPKGNEHLPACLSAAGVMYVERIREEQTESLNFACGGADNHYGIIVCFSPGPPKRTWPIRKQLSDHVWLYDELSF
jgi:hypothetical protein